MGRMIVFLSASQAVLEILLYVQSFDPFNQKRFLANIPIFVLQFHSIKMGLFYMFILREFQEILLELKKHQNFIFLSKYCRISEMVHQICLEKFPWMLQYTSDELVNLFRQITCTCLHVCEKFNLKPNFSVKSHDRGKLHNKNFMKPKK